MIRCARAQIQYTCKGIYYVLGSNNLYVTRYEVKVHICATDFAISCTYSGKNITLLQRQDPVIKTGCCIDNSFQIEKFLRLLVRGE